MITPSAEEVEARRRGIVRRTPWVVLLVLLMTASVFAPTVGVRVATEFGRSLLPASAFFLAAQAGGPGFGPVSDVDSLAAGLNLAYFGLSFQQVGLLLGVAFCWVLVVPDVGRWVRRLALVGGWCLAISAPVVIIAYQLIEGGGVAAYLGGAWVFSLLAGLVLVGGARLAKRRLDSTWYWSKPDWNG
ncbi:hypothetical protein [Microlunatus flavus]|uniref:Uncharacterized protein n=1 Tax=Microlunatus flavus TaxID=1036181 RepID=A0A1H9AGS1_9ACTN|nr:hypothetical protein [Microlunatus flavus]SEP75926.1 hypothetical protein SAMN05421756_101605 [Microlunatus flavus]